MKLRVGTRKSQLALSQTDWVVDKLSKLKPDLEVEIVKIETKGDKILDKTLSKVGGKALFLKEIEHALLDHEIDFAVHSMKDIPTDIPDQLEICTITNRLDPRDVLISKDSRNLDELPDGSVIGTSSLRRSSQLKTAYSNIDIVPVRGNLNTRYDKLMNQNTMDGLILAKAGVERMNFTSTISQVIPQEIIVPCVGQGALGIEVVSDKQQVKDILTELEDTKCRREIEAERAFLAKLGGSCHVPVGALCELEGKSLELTGVVSSLDGTELLKNTVTGSIDHPVDLGNRLAEELISKGAKEILEEAEQEVD